MNTQEMLSGRRVQTQASCTRIRIATDFETVGRYIELSTVLIALEEGLCMRERSEEVIFRQARSGSRYVA